MPETEKVICSECFELLRCRNAHTSYEKFPVWYRAGKQCPLCGAGYESEFGKRQPAPPRL